MSSINITGHIIEYHKYIKKTSSYSDSIYLYKYTIDNSKILLILMAQYLILVKFGKQVVDYHKSLVETTDEILMAMPANVKNNLNEQQKYII
jgi:hypothetical protein